MSWNETMSQIFDEYTMIRLMHAEITSLRKRVTKLETNDRPKQDPTITNENEGTSLDQLDGDHDAMLEIQTLLDGVEWTSDTLDQIAHILIKSGYRVRDLNDRDVEER